MSSPKAELWAAVYAAEYAATRARMQACWRPSQEELDNPMYGSALPGDSAHRLATQQADEAVQRLELRFGAYHG